MEDNLINAKLKLITKLKKETTGAYGYIIIKEDGSYLYNFTDINKILKSNNFVELLTMVIDYISNHRQYIYTPSTKIYEYPHRKVTYKHGHKKKYKLKNSNGKKEDRKDRS